MKRQDIVLKAIKDGWSGFTKEELKSIDDRTQDATRSIISRIEHRGAFKDASDEELYEKVKRFIEISGKEYLNEVKVSKAPEIEGEIKGSDKPQAEKSETSPRPKRRIVDQSKKVVLPESKPITTELPKIDKVPSLSDTTVDLSEDGLSYVENSTWNAVKDKLKNEPYWVAKKWFPEPLSQLSKTDVIKKAIIDTINSIQELDRHQLHDELLNISKILLNKYLKLELPLNDLFYIVVNATKKMCLELMQAYGYPTDLSLNEEQVNSIEENEDYIQAAKDEIDRYLDQMLESETDNNKVRQILYFKLSIINGKTYEELLAAYPESKATKYIWRTRVKNILIPKLSTNARKYLSSLFYKNNELDNDKEEVKQIDTDSAKQELSGVVNLLLSEAKSETKKNQLKYFSLIYLEGKKDEEVGELFPDSSYNTRRAWLNRAINDILPKVSEEAKSFIGLRARRKLSNYSHLFKVAQIFNIMTAKRDL